MSERCEARCPGADQFQCEREAGHLGFHRYGDERVPSGALVWHPTDELMLFSDRVKKATVTISREGGVPTNPPLTPKNHVSTSDNRSDT